MKSIWKRTVEHHELRRGMFEVEAPGLGSVLHVGTQDGECPVLWFAVDTDREEHSVSFEIGGTGTPKPIGLHVGSCICGSFVWHIFEVPQ